MIRSLDPTAWAAEGGLVRVAWHSYRDWAALGAAVAGPLGMSGGLVPFRRSFPNTDAALVLVVVVVAVAANGHRVAGLLAAISAAAWFDFFLTAPYERFSITHRSDIETTMLLLAVGTIVTELAVRGRRQRAVAVTEAAYLAAIGSTAHLVASEAAAPAVIDQVSDHLVALLGLRGCRFESGPTGSRSPRLEPDGRVSIDGGYWDLHQFGMPGSPVQIDATCNGRSYGRFVLEPVVGTVAPLPARQVAVVLAKQAAAAIASELRMERSRVLGGVSRS